jgi:hypothetical protein
VVQFSLTVSKSTGAGALKNPHVTFGTCFVHDFPGATDSIYVDFFLVNRGCEHFRIHASPLESVSFTVAETTVAPFSLRVSKSTGVGAVKNPLVTIGTCFIDDFLVATYSVSVDFF